jgi:hypothetical protein
MMPIWHYSCLLLVIFQVCDAGKRAASPGLASSGHAPPELQEPSEALLSESVSEMEMAVTSGPHGAISHIKVATSSHSDIPPASDFAKGVAASLALRAKQQAARAAAESCINNALDSLEPGARLNLDTPADDNCLFWALLEGGMAMPAEMGDVHLSILELRQIALSLATEEELQLAAMSTTSDKHPQGLSVEEYKRGMLTGMWGDHLTVGCLARAFHRDITVVGTNSVRTYLEAGGDVEGHLDTAIWVGHRGEWHYYGVKRVSATVPDDSKRHADYSAVRAAVQEGRVSPTDGVNFLTSEHVLELANKGVALAPGDAQQQQKRRRLTGKCAAPPSFSQSRPASPSVCKASEKAPKGSKLPRTQAKKAATDTKDDSNNADKRRICGNCGVRGHQAATCQEPCFACGGEHKYFECDHPDFYMMAKRQANRNRVAWKGLGAKAVQPKCSGGMKQSGTGKYWLRQPYDPEYTPERDKSPKRKYLDKVRHPSDRCKVSLRVLWDQTEEMAMNSLIDGGFLTDTCLDRQGNEVPCKGTLCVYYYTKEERHDRKLCCVGVPETQRHRMHFLAGSVFQGHTRLDAQDVCGVLQCFAAGKSPEVTSMDTGLHRTTVGPLLDRLRMAATLVAEDQREHMIFENCQVEANETVVRKEKVYATLPDKSKVRTGTIHHSVICLTQRGSTKQLMYLCEPKEVAIAASGKPSPPALPSVALVLPMLAKHFGNFVVLHTDGAPAYASACAKLQEEGFSVVQDHVVHSQQQWSAFGRHVVDDTWEGCDFALVNENGERRIRVIKGTQKAEGLWRHLKHSEHSIPEEVHHDDERLNLYVQSLVWRMQCVGCPYQEKGSKLGVI